MENLRTGSLGLLLDQLDSARELAQARLEELISPASLLEGTPLGPRRESGRLSDSAEKPASAARSALAATPLRDQL